MSEYDSSLGKKKTGSVAEPRDEQRTASPVHAILDMASTKRESIFISVPNFLNYSVNISFTVFFFSLYMSDSFKCFDKNL